MNVLAEEEVDLADVRGFEHLLGESVHAIIFNSVAASLRQYINMNF